MFLPEATLKLIQDLYTNTRVRKMYIADLINAIMPESPVTSVQVSQNIGRSSAALGGLETRLPRDRTEVQEGQLLR